MAKQTDPVKLLMNKYQVTEDEIIKPDEGEKLIIRKTGVLKVERREGIFCQVHDVIVNSVTTKVGQEEAVHMTGEATLYNNCGFPIKKYQEAASATPENCTFSHKTEVCMNRLRARLVFGILGLNNVMMSVDELVVTRAGKQENADKLSEDLIKQAVDATGATSNRL